MRKVGKHARTFVCVPLLIPRIIFGHRLTEVDMNTTIVNKHVIHLEIGCFATLCVLVLDERIVQRHASATVANHLATVHTNQFLRILLVPFDLAESAKDNFEIVFNGDRV